MKEEQDWWARAMAEVEDAQLRDAGLWARCFAEADGNEARAKAAYIKDRVRGTEARPAMGFCPNCNSELAMDTKSCPACDAIFEGASWAPTLTPRGAGQNRAPKTKEGQSQKPPEAQTKKGGVWRWVIGVPVVLFVLMMVIGNMNNDPVQDNARRAYKLCLDDLAASDRARNGNGTFIAGACEKMRQDYIEKYGNPP